MATDYLRAVQLALRYVENLVRAIQINVNVLRVQSYSIERVEYSCILYEDSKNPKQVESGIMVCNKPGSSYLDKYECLVC